MVTQDLDVRWRTNPGARRAYFLAFFLAAGLGAAFLIGGAERIVAPAFATVRDTGGHVAWGVGFLAVAVAMLAAPSVSLLATRITILLAGFLHCLFAIGIINSAAAAADASILGCVTYSVVTVWHWHQAVLYEPNRG